MRNRSFLLALIATGVASLALTGGAGPVIAQDEGLVEIVILNTSDEHGWLEPFTPYGSDTTQGGAAVLYEWWATHEGYDPENDAFVLISDGDNWTGPPLSTWFEGEPVVEAMNWMGYDATVVGNHEFDFGRDVLDQRIAAANFPTLSANIRYTESGELADFVQPYVIVEAAGVQVGIIGLTSTDTPTTTHPKNITDLEFAPYEDALAEYVPQMRDAGADIVIVAAHACIDELVALAGEVEVDAMLAGHCHELGALTIDDTPILGSGWAWRSYARLTLSYNPGTNSVEAFDYALERVEYTEAEANPELLALIQPWEARTEEVLGQEIGYLAEDMPQQSWIQANWVTDAWLWAYPSADVAITNFGGFRQEVLAGPVTVGEIVGVLPFENRIVEVNITGAQLIENLDCCGGAVGGISYSPSGTGWSVTFLDGREFDEDAVYSVLVNDFMYAGGDEYLFGEQDPDGYDTGIQWRQPVIDWTLSLETTEDDPLENYLDPARRGPRQ